MGTRLRMAAFLVAGLACAAPAEEGSFHSLAAREAKAKYEAALQKAADEYARLHRAATAAYLAELEGVLRGTMKNGDIAEAKLLDAEVDGLRVLLLAKDVRNPSEAIRGVWEFKYPADKMWRVTFDGRGGAFYVDASGKHDGGKLRAIGGEIWLRSSPEEIERLSISGKRIFIEYWHWKDTDPLPNDKPELFGVANRVD